MGCCGLNGGRLGTFGPVHRPMPSGVAMDRNNAPPSGKQPVDLGHTDAISAPRQAVVLVHTVGAQKRVFMRPFGNNAGALAQPVRGKE